MPDRAAIRAHAISTGITSSLSLTSIMAVRYSSSGPEASNAAMAEQTRRIWDSVRVMPTQRSSPLMTVTERAGAGGHIEAHGDPAGDAPVQVVCGFLQAVGHARNLACQSGADLAVIR